MKLQIISDIHLEFISDFKINPIAPNLVLCGDIGYPGDIDYKFFINNCSDLFKNVFLILGNHEFYNDDNSLGKKSICDIKEIVKSFIPNNVYLLDNKSLYIDNSNIVYYNKPFGIKCFKIIGSTLWSNPNDSIVDDCVFIYNDFNCIYTDKDVKLTVESLKKMNKECTDFILNEIKNETSDCILLTHHGSHQVCNGNYPISILNSLFVNNLQEIYKFPQLKVCISGHTHSSIDKYVNFGTHEIRFISNQYGYEDDIIDSEFKEDKYIELI